MDSFWEGADFFSERLYYDQGNTSLSAPAQYNGNIAWVEWRTGLGCSVNGTGRNKAAYGFTYDGLNRMTNAKYTEFDPFTGLFTNTDNYNEALTYDRNGNILTLNRRGRLTNGTFAQIDNLTYTYGNASFPNQLSAVAEASDKTKGLKSVLAGTTGSYTYDANGNVLTDQHKGITNITYNYLNLPAKIFFGAVNYIEVTYDATGKKLRKVSYNGSATTTKNYSDGIEYSGTALEAIYHSEGRVIKPTASTNQYQYTLKDHLGNSRAMFRMNGSTPELIQENHYYPFGLEMEGNWQPQLGVENLYQYNGKELNEDLGLNWNDYGARWYDAAVGRWGQVDPMAEKYNYQSPYNYVSNNPVKFLDLFGMDESSYNPRDVMRQRKAKWDERSKRENQDEASATKDPCPPGVNCGDPVPNPRISNDNAKKENSNRFMSVRTRKNGTKRYHKGVDILAPIGTNVSSMLKGTVVSVHNNVSNGTDGNGGLGNTVVVQSTLADGSDVYIKYAHLDQSSNTLGLKVGDAVDVGDQIGIAGDTGNASKINSNFHHVHIEASTSSSFTDKTRINPEQFMDTKFNKAGLPIPVSRLTLLSPIPQISRDNTAIYIIMPFHE